MSTTLNLYSIPNQSNGLSLLMGTNVAWRYSQWKVVAPFTNADMSIVGVVAQSQFIGGGADLNHENIYEIGIGEVGNPTLIVQLSRIFRGDTAVGFPMEAYMWLPEPRFIPKGSTLSMRFACGQGGQYTSDGVRILVMSDRYPISTEETVRFENYKGVSAASGMSVSEKVR